MTRPTLKGSKGGSSTFKQTPDNLRSNDTFEGVLGVAIGPLKGPTRGLKSIKLDGTAIENETGEQNFPGFIATIGDGDPAKFPQTIGLKLGAGASPMAVNLTLTNTNTGTGTGTPGPWLTKTLSNTGANAIDLRFIVNELARQDKNGIYNNTLTIEIQLKPVAKTTWINPTIGAVTGSYSETGLSIPGFNNGQFIKGYFPEDMFVDDTPGSPFATTNSNFVITGKTGGSPSVYELRLTVPNEGTGYVNTAWDVRARLLERATYDADPVYEKRNVSWESMAAVYSSTMGDHEDWRGVAWMQMYGKASDQLTGVPEVTGEWDTKIISVPPSSIYNPDTRQYVSGIWDGTWAKAYTNDPAWVIADAISDPLSGLSLIAAGSHLNKWDALEASKWASQLVPDGNGGMHPRYSMNIAINDPQKAEEFIRYLAGAIGALAWDRGDGEWRMKVDKPDTPVDVFTLENIAGEFLYSHTDVDTRFNDVIGQFKNADMDYRQDAVRLYDSASIAVLGRKPTTVALVGCTNRQEALRRVKLRLRTAVNETRIVTFSTNRRGRNVEPLSLILVADADLGDTDKHTTGRLVDISADRKTIQVRDPLRLEIGIDYTLDFTIPNPDYNPATTTQPTSADWKKPTIVQTRSVTNTSGQRGNVTTLYLDTALPTDIAENMSVALSATGLVTTPKLYRVTAVSPNDDNEEIMSISAIEVDVGKWDAADNVDPQDSVFVDMRGAVPQPLPPTSGSVLSLVAVPVEQGKQVNLITNWERPKGSFVNGFRVRHRINGGEWVLDMDRTQGTSFEFINPTPGIYDVEITTLNRAGGASLPLTASYTITQQILDATSIYYLDPTTHLPTVPISSLQPAAAGATPGAQTGVNLLNGTGSTVLTDTMVRNNAITTNADGTLSGAGGGAAPNLSSIAGALDLTTAKITNKSLAAVDAAANTKLGGIAAGATQNRITYSPTAPTSPTPVDGDSWALTTITGVTTSTALPSAVTLTRSTTATYYDVTGALATAAINAARFSYNPTTHAVLGMFIEPAATNMMRKSENFGSTWITDAGATVTIDATTAPDGNATADLLQSMSGNNQQTRSQSVTLTAGTWVYSVFFKAKEYTKGILVAQADGTYPYAVFDLTAGTATVYGSAISASGITSVGNGWYRCWIVFAAPAGTNTHYISPTNGTSFTFTGDGTSGIYAWGAQTELGTTPSSYIPTTTTAITRAADAYVINWGTLGVADGVTNIRYTFDDASYQDVSTTVASGSAAIPTNLTRSRIVSATATAYPGAVVGYYTRVGGAWVIAADITSANVPALLYSNPSIEFNANYAGTLLAGEISKTVAFQRKVGSTDVSSATTWGATGTSGITCSISSTGLLSFTAVSAGSVNVTAAYGGTTLTYTLPVTKALGASPSGGSSGSTSATVSAASSVASATYGSAATTVMTVRAGASGQIDLSAPLSFDIYSAGTRSAAGKWQWRVVGGTFADVGTEVASSNSAYYPAGHVVGQDPYSGYIEVTQAKTGLTNGTDYEFQLLLRASSATPTMYFSGNATAIQH